MLVSLSCGEAKKELQSKGRVVVKKRMRAWHGGSEPPHARVIVAA